MRTVTRYRFRVTDKQRPGGRPYLTRYWLTPEEAADRYATAEPDLSTREELALPETEAERRAIMQSAGHNGVR